MMEINLFRSMFKGRDDVFAIRWEKENKSGYSPAYSYDPYYYKRHRMAGGIFRQKLLPLQKAGRFQKSTASAHEFETFSTRLAV